MTREQAALLLGVDIDADPRQVRRAWRLWTRLAHPDVGGDRDHFEALTQARDLLLRSREFEAGAEADLDFARVVPPRPRLRQVCRRPGTLGLLAVATAAAAVVVGSLMSTLMPTVVAALVLGVTSSVVAVASERGLLQPWADPGHRIALLTGVWLPVAVTAGVSAVMAGTDLIPVLPVVALPFVTVIALVNPGAGHWRRVGVSS